jgi:hypothetical protein
MAWMIADLHRRKAFSPALCIDIRYFSNRHSAEVAIAYDGCTLAPQIELLFLDGTRKLLSADGIIDDFLSIDALEIALPGGTDRRLQVHAFRIFGGFEAVPLAGVLRLRHGERGSQDLALDVSSGITRVNLPMKSAHSTAVTISAPWARKGDTRKTQIAM